MDPSRNPALQDAKLQTILLPTTAPRQGSSPDSVHNMPPPPAYHTVVDPTDRLPSMHNPYDLEEEEGKDEDVPEINVNATTQIRGHGNIISIAQMDSMRIANLLAILIHGGLPPQANANAASAQDQAQAQGPRPHTQAQASQAQARRHAQERRELPKINININCGATVVGDRNIVGPGLGDIARHIQIAQQRQQQQQQQQNQVHVDARTNQPQRPGCAFPGPGQPPMATPPMSRSSSLGSDGSGGVKRKADEEVRKSPVKRAR